METIFGDVNLHEMQMNGRWEQGEMKGRDTDKEIAFVEGSIEDPRRGKEELERRRQEKVSLRRGK